MSTVLKLFENAVHYSSFLAWLYFFPDTFVYQLMSLLSYTQMTLTQDYAVIHLIHCTLLSYFFMQWHVRYCMVLTSISSLLHAIVAVVAVVWIVGTTFMHVY